MLNDVDSHSSVVYHWFLYHAMSSSHLWSVEPGEAIMFGEFWVCMCVAAPICTRQMIRSMRRHPDVLMKKTHVYLTPQTSGDLMMTCASARVPSEMHTPQTSNPVGSMSIEQHLQHNWAHESSYVYTWPTLYGLRGMPRVDASIPLGTYDSNIPCSSTHTHVE